MSTRSKISEIRTSLLKDLNLRDTLFALLGSAIMAFALYNIHSLSGVTEGGILGLTLFLEHWFHISPAVSGLILNISCYVMGWKLLGKRFLLYSIIASSGFSGFYFLFEQFDPLFPALAEMPLVAALVGALCIGTGAGLCVRIDAAPGGDDALAMSIATISHMKIQWAYLICDLVVLGMSLSYIPLNRILYSLLTVTLSGQLIGLMQRLPAPKSKTCPA